MIFLRNKENFQYQFAYQKQIEKLGKRVTKVNLNKNLKMKCINFLLILQN